MASYYVKVMAQALLSVYLSPQYESALGRVHFEKIYRNWRTPQVKYGYIQIRCLLFFEIARYNTVSIHYGIESVDRLVVRMCYLIIR